MTQTARQRILRRRTDSVAPGCTQERRDGAPVGAEPNRHDRAVTHRLPRAYRPRGAAITLAWILSRAKPDGECLLWIGMGGAYGHVRRHGRRELVHRLAFELAHGPLDPGQVVRHRCHATRCVNPAHLVSGTDADNVADRVAAGRSARGERNGRAKLTADDVRVIRDSVEAPAVLAGRYGVDPKAIRLVLVRKNWGHVQ
jgi:hypothetical protein